MGKIENIYIDKNFKYLSLIPPPKDSQRKHCLNETRTEYTKKEYWGGAIHTTTQTDHESIMLSEAQNKRPHII